MGRVTLFNLPHSPVNYTHFIDKQTEAWVFPHGSAGKESACMQETQEMQVQPLGQEDPLKEEIATHSSILAREIPWTEEPGGLQFKGSQRVRHN